MRRRYRRRRDDAYAFDRYLRYDELTAWLDEVAAAHPDLVGVETYGRSHEGRDLWLVTVTDTATGPHDTKPAHWVDASIHAVELTGDGGRVLSAAATSSTATPPGIPIVTEALRTRTFYVVPRVNPDGAEWALADPPTVPPVEHPTVAMARRPPLAGPARRGRRRRRPHPADAHR